MKDLVDFPVIYVDLNIYALDECRQKNRQFKLESVPQYIKMYSTYSYQA